MEIYAKKSKKKLKIKYFERYEIDFLYKLWMIKTLGDKTQTQ